MNAVTVLSAVQQIRRIGGGSRSQLIARLRGLCSTGKSDF